MFAHAVVAVVDERGALLSCSPGMQRLLGYAPSELEGLRWTDLLAFEADVARFTECCREDEPGFLIPAHLRHRDGGEVEVSLRAHRLDTSAGEPHWLLQAETDEATHFGDLRRALLRGLFTESPYIIDVFDDRLRFLAQNRSRRRTGGFVPQVIGRTMREVAPSGLLDMDALEARQRHVLTTGKALIATEVHGHKPEAPNRDAVWSETIVPLRGGSRNVVGLAHLVLDVTDEARARERLHLINEASARIGSDLDVMHTAEELTDVAVPRFADYAYVNLLDTVYRGRDPRTGTAVGAVPLVRVAQSVRAGAVVDFGVSKGSVDPVASAPASRSAQALASGTPVLLTGDELYTEFVMADPYRAALIRELDVRSWLLVPMCARGAQLGTVVFIRRAQGDPFDADDILLAKEFVARAGLCIDNASRYTYERTTAMALQRSLLPQRLPGLRTVETTSRYLPAGGDAVLGGAWFDVIRLSSARVGLVVGDAAGSGLRSAVTMGGLRRAVRTLADLDLSPEELLTSLDENVKRFQDDQGTGPDGATGTTCLYAVYDPVSRHCALASAGHPRPARVTANGRAALIDMPIGSPLGTGGIPFECAEVTLDDGDVLVLHTVGLVKPQNGGDMDAGLQALGEVLSALGSARASQRHRPSGELGDFCDTILRRVLPHPPQKDVALLAALVHGLKPDLHAAWELTDEFEVVGQARELATGKLDDWGLGELIDTTQLLVSELVTNAIRYGRPPIRLRLIRDRNLICEVSDSSSTSPHVRHALETDEGGRGLFLVAQLAELWGTRYHERGKSIWAEQSLEASPPR
ncbi:SpoIIE family protein phosphatase [Streptomyces sp. ISID311]|uniref:SpoIIE family protein phosphatase n=1 Tax=Streptomyces sp. ISID311 TaxID=2601673 RepID=UPI00164B9564|nr:SpoIIE family protein phosphatase [Streptomyces sp. ISID311]